MSGGLLPAAGDSVVAAWLFRAWLPSCFARFPLLLIFLDRFMMARLRPSFVTRSIVQRQIRRVAMAYPYRGGRAATYFLDCGDHA